MPEVMPAHAPMFTDLANVVILGGHGMLIHPRAVDRAKATGHAPQDAVLELTLQLPPRVSVTVWCHTQVFVDETVPIGRSADRFTLDDDIGVLVESARFNEARAMVENKMEHLDRGLPLTFTPGEVIPNLMLLPPRTLNVGTPATGALLYRIGGYAKTLRDCVRKFSPPNRDTHFHWAACSEIEVRQIYVGREAWPSAPATIFGVAATAYRNVVGPALPDRLVPLPAIPDDGLGDPLPPVPDAGAGTPDG